MTQEGDASNGFLFLYDCGNLRANRIKIEKSEEVESSSFILLREVSFDGQAVPTGAPGDYLGYVTRSETDKPVCKKHWDDGRMCNLWLSCHFDQFKSGITGQKHCADACGLLNKYFPREMCDEHHWNEINAGKFDYNSDTKTVCYNKNAATGRQCVQVEHFVYFGTNDQGEPRVYVTDPKRNQD